MYFSARQDKSTTITLEFPEVRNLELTTIMSAFRDEINRELVNIKVKSIVSGSLEVNIVVTTDILLNAKSFQQELTVLFRHMTTISALDQCFNDLHTVNVVISECIGK